MKSLAIIPARGGSQRIPRKNIRPFLGKPIMAYSIEVALQSGLFDTVMVSTDDAEIADVARQYGASVPFTRSARNADHHATTVDVLLEVLDWYHQQGDTPPYACCLYPTAPFVTAALLKQAYTLLTDTPTDSVFPVQPYPFPIQRALAMNDSTLTWINPQYAQTRSQDLPPAYHDTGQFYFFLTMALRQYNTLLMPATQGLIINEMQAHDIDTEADWQVAEFKYRITNDSEAK